MKTTLPSEHFTYFNDLSDALPNLDGFTSPDELRELQAEAKAIAAGIKDLGNYAEAKANAMQCRLAGNIAAAIKFEAAADFVYNRLPEWARW